MTSLFKKPKAPKAPEPSAAQKELEQRQISEKRRLEREENKKYMAMKRKRSGRSSLISHDEGGIKDTLG